LHFLKVTLKITFKNEPILIHPSEAQLLTITDLSSHSSTHPTPLIPNCKLMGTLSKNPIKHTNTITESKTFFFYINLSTFYNDLRPVVTYQTQASSSPQMTIFPKTAKIRPLRRFTPHSAPYPLLVPKKRHTGHLRAQIHRYRNCPFLFLFTSTIFSYTCAHISIKSPSTNQINPLFSTVNVHKGDLLWEKNG